MINSIAGAIIALIVGAILYHFRIWPFSDTCPICKGTGEMPNCDGSVFDCPCCQGKGRL